MAPSITSSTIMEPGGTIGILGGGQLGRMLALAAARLGLKTHIYCPEQHCPASECAAFSTIAPYEDEEALALFAADVDIITFEFENIPAQSIEYLNSIGAIVYPNVYAMETAQDRLHEKQFLNAIGANTARFHPVEDLASLEAGLLITGRPAILKTRRLGYDGKGQTLLRDDTADLPDTFQKAIEFAWREVGAAPSILESFVPFEREISVIGARSVNGEVKLFAPSENVHDSGILKKSTVPADISNDTIDKAYFVVTKLLNELDYVGVAGIEFFVDKQGDVIVNEFAPRVHNTGHWTMDASSVCQFEQHIRAVVGWPLANPQRHSNAIMENLIGDDINRWRECANEDGVCIHLYGKKQARSGRKMGHVTRLYPKG